MNPLIILFTALVLSSTSTDGDTLASAPESTVTAPVPPARSGHTTIYDPVRRRLIVFGGGFPIEIDGAVVGAVGVSGGHYKQDMEVAEAGLAALK